MTEVISKIPTRIKNAAVGGHVCGTEDVIDDELGLTQDQINQQTVGVKEYNPSDYSGMGRKNLPKNMVNGVNTLTQAMMPLATGQNTIYVIQYDYVLGENITVPENCVLEFDGGSLSNGTLVGQNTIISDTHCHIFSSVTLTGSWTNDALYPEWFGAKMYDKSIYGQSTNGLVSAISAFNDMLNSIQTIPHIKLNAVYFTDDEITIAAPRYNFSIYSDVKTNGIYAQPNSENKCIINVTQGSTYGVFGAAYRCFTLRSSSMSSPLNAGIRCQNHIGSKMSELYCYSMQVKNGAYFFDIAGGNIFNNSFYDIEASEIHGDGLHYGVAEGAYLPIMQKIDNCRFHGLMGCGITTDLVSVTQGTISGEITNCELEGNYKGSIFFSRVGGLKVVNCYFEGAALQSYKDDLYPAAFTFGIYLNSAKTAYAGSKIDDLNFSTGNIGYTGNDNVAGIMLYPFKNDGTPYNGTSSLKAINIESTNYTVNTTYFIFVYYGSLQVYNCKKNSQNTTINDIVSKNSCINIRPGDASYNSAYFLQSDPLHSKDIYGLVNENSTLKTMTKGGALLCENGTSFNIPSIKNKIYHTPFGLFQAKTSGKIFYTSNATYTQGSNVVSVNAAWVIEVGEKIYGPWFTDGEATVTAKTSNSLTLDKEALYSESNSNIFTSIVLPISLVNPCAFTTSNRPNGKMLDVGACIFDKTLSKPIWWNGTAWVETDGAIAGVKRSGITADRPVGSSIYVGFMYFDTSLSPARPIYASAISSDTVTWVDATGATV